MKKAMCFFVCLYAHFVEAQNTGIGTAIPLAPLHVKTTGPEVIRAEGSWPYISFYDNTLGYRGYVWSSPAGKIELGSANGSNLPVTIAPNQTVTTTFLANGNVGIGVTAPQYPLHLTGFSQYSLFASNTNSGSGNAIAGVIYASDGAGVEGVAISSGESFPGYEPGPYALLGTAGAATGIGAFTSTGTAVKAKSNSGLALHTSGGVRLTGIAEGSNKVLTSDANGNATWQSINQNPQTGFSAIMLSNQSIATGTYITLSGFAEAFDTGNNFDVSTGTFTAPTAGVYHLQASIAWQAPAADTYAWVQFYYNGGTVPGTVSATFLKSGMMLSTSHSFNAILNAGTTVQLRVLQSSGSALNALGGVNPLTTNFSCVRVY